MKIYSGVLRLYDAHSTSVNEVPVSNISAPEVLVLRDIHGPTSLRNLRQVDNQNRRHADEWDRLEARYQNTAHTDARDVLKRVFPAGRGSKLPLEVDLECTMGPSDAPEEAEAA